MSGSLNKVMLIGNLGKDPEVKTIPSGTKVANFSLATTEKYTDKSGQKVEKTEWHKIILWKGLAEIAERYLKKGSTVYIEGKLTTRSWDDKDGQKKYTTEIVGDQLQMLGGKAGGGSSGSSDGGDYSYSKQDSGSYGQSSGGKSGYQDLSMPASPEDDLPF
jgi:single-strand DNA-binding protein